MAGLGRLWLTVESLASDVQLEDITHGFIRRAFTYLYYPRHRQTNQEEARVICSRLVHLYAHLPHWARKLVGLACQILCPRLVAEHPSRS